MTSLEYPFTVRPLDSEDGGGYLIEFPDLPGCMSDGETIEEAIENGADAMREAGRPIPLPSKGEDAYSGKWQQRVPNRCTADVPSVPSGKASACPAFEGGGAISGQRTIQDTRHRVFRPQCSPWRPISRNFSRRRARRRPPS